jgi:lipopolysaccharide export system permease protein
VTLLDRHIFRSALATCLAAVAVFMFVIMTANIAKDLAAPDALGKLSWFQIGRLLLLLAPIGAMYGLPLGMLVGVLLALSRLAADNEITGMRAAGVSLKRIAAPIIVLGLIGTAVEIPVSFGFMPRARVQYQHDFEEAVRANPLNFIVPRTFVRSFSKAVIFVGDRKDRNISDIWFWKLDDQNRVKDLVHARSGAVDYDPASFALILTLRDCLEEKLGDANPEDYADKDALPVITTMASLDPSPISLKGIFSRTTSRQKLDWMTHRELEAERIRRSQDKTLSPSERVHAVMQVKMTIVDKLTWGVAVFALAFVAVPLGIQVSRRETSASLVLGVVIGLSYYAMTRAVDLLDRHPEVRPDLLLWLPIVLVFAVGIALFRHIDRRRA